MARRDEVLDKKRTQAFLCAPSYKREIEDLGNQGKFHPGADVVFLKIFSPKNLAKILAFFAQTTASFCKKIGIITLVFEKNANFFAENWQKSQKIVIITSTPDHVFPRDNMQCRYIKCTSLGRLNSMYVCNGCMYANQKSPELGLARNRYTDVCILHKWLTQTTIK
jgi:hypothetical protein